MMGDGDRGRPVQRMPSNGTSNGSATGEKAHSNQKSPAKHGVQLMSPQIHDEMQDKLKARRDSIELAEQEEAFRSAIADGVWGASLEAPPGNSNQTPSPRSDASPSSVGCNLPSTSEWDCYIENEDESAATVQDARQCQTLADDYSRRARGRQLPQQASRISPTSRIRSASPTSRQLRSPQTDSEPLPSNVDGSNSRESSRTRSYDGSSRDRGQERRKSSGSPAGRRSLSQQPPRSWLHGDPMNPRRSVLLDEDNQFAAIQFARWATGRWEQLHELFSVDSRLATVVQRCKVTENDFVDYCRRHGFDGDANRVFREIAGEGKGRACDAYGDSKSESRSIRLPQFLRFQRYASALAAPVVSTGVEGFVSSLQQQGTLLRAWRVYLDRRGKGWVTFEDLAHACRKLGFPGEARNLWSAMRAHGDTTPLKFSEFAPEEASNLEQLTEMLWHRCGFDLDRAWSRIDTGNRGAVTLEEFTRGVRGMGFEGNARLIFRGLDTTGLGRLRRLDFDYTQAFLTVGSCAQIAVSHAAPPIRALGSWVQEELGGPEVFVAKLGLTESPNEAKVLPTISVKDFAAALHSLGYPGDALQAAVTAARSGDGAQISGTMLLNLLTGRPIRNSLGSPDHSESPRSGKFTPTSTGSFRKALWNSSIDTSTSGNACRHKGTRSYFSAPEKGHIPLYHSASCRDVVIRKPPMQHKVAWNSSVENVSQECAKKSRYTRTYFSVPGKKPLNGTCTGAELNATRRRPGSDPFLDGPPFQPSVVTPPVRRRPGRDSFSEEIPVASSAVNSTGPSPGNPPRPRRRPGRDSFSEDPLASMPITAAVMANEDFIQQLSPKTPVSAASPTTSPKSPNTPIRSPTGTSAAGTPTRKAAPALFAGKKYNAVGQTGPIKRRIQPGEDSGEDSAHC